MSYMQIFISFLMMQVIFVVIEYKISHVLAIIEFNRRKSLIARFQELAAK
jgi:exopolysaccharide biosynthesis protein